MRVDQGSIATKDTNSTQNYLDQVALTSNLRSKPNFQGFGPKLFGVALLRQGH